MFTRQCCLFLLFIFSAFNFYSYSQELPPIENYAPIAYLAENQNWGVSQSKQKDIYVANSGGLLEFNGAVWRLYGSPNGSAIRSVKAIGDIIFTGCYMEFGYWQRNAFEDLVYTSISAKLTVPLIEDEEFWNIVELDDWVLFQSKERIYVYNTKDESIEVIDSQSTKAHIFDYNGTIYHHSVGQGLFKIENGRSVLVSDDTIVKSTVVSGIFSIQNRPLLVTEKGEFYFFDSGSLVQWNTSFKAISGAINVYSSLQLADESIVLGTISNGIYHLGVNGTLLQKINQEKGLNNNTVLSIFEDADYNLWLALDNGISVINMNSPFNEYIDKNGKLGVVYASRVHEGYLYLGTNQGLFYKAINTNDEFNLVANTKGQVWLLKEIDGDLFCGHNNGTYLIQNTKAELISDFPGTWDVKPIPNRGDLLLQGNFNGLSILSKTGLKWAFRNQIANFDISSRFFEFKTPQELFVNRELKGIFKLKFDADYTKVIEEVNMPSKGMGASLVPFDDNLLYASNNGILKYSGQKQEFIADTTLTNAFYGQKDDPIGIFIPDEASRRLWCFTHSNIAYVSPGKFSEHPRVNKISIPSYVRKNLGVLGFESLTPLGNERYLVGISNGYLTINLKKLASREHKVRLNSVSVSTSDSKVLKIANNGTNTFGNSQNNFIFSYHVAEFDKYTEVNYQYQLEGRYNEWSEWTGVANTAFENLPSGKYTFNVRAKVGNDISTNEASYSFKIERPWYLSNLAIILYVLILALFAVLIHKLYKRYYRKQHELLVEQNKKKLKRKKLKAQKKIVQLSNDKLKEEVASKNRELAISTMSIIKKNEFLNAIKDQLKENADNPAVKSVIRTIDQNINNKDDWKFFEDAFNNADKDFLKRVKKIHPELTSNDLRLCAYLRLNLSSKEIAPLLNISVRSVEVKRYRLRKKMNLLHEDGLANYIMEL